LDITKLSFLARNDGTVLSTSRVFEVAPMMSQLV